LPVDTEHEWQATHNARLLCEPLLDPRSTQYPDWAINVMFYRAVHIIDKALACRGVIDVRNHEHRKKSIVRHLRGCLGYFQAFEELSRKTRYEVMRPTRTDVEDALQLLSNIERGA
jgi:hypothetical protein